MEFYFGIFDRSVTTGERNRVLFAFVFHLFFNIIYNLAIVKASGQEVHIELMSHVLILLKIK